MGTFDNDYALAFQSDLSEEDSERLAQSHWFRVRIAVATSPWIGSEATSILLRDHATEVALATFKNPHADDDRLRTFLQDAEARNHAFVADYIWNYPHDPLVKRAFWRVLNLLDENTPAWEYFVMVDPAAFWTEELPLPFRWSEGVYGDHHY